MAITPTAITTEQQIYLLGSPVNIRVSNLAVDNTIKSAVVELYVWSGDLDTPPALASYTLVADKVSKNDTYINFQIAEIIASHITGTKFAWQSGDGAPSISGEGVFFQYKYQVTNESLAVESSVTKPTNFATNGYRYDFEQKGSTTADTPYLGLLPINYNRNYIDEVKYFRRNFDFTKTLSECTSENIISSTPFTPTETKCQLSDKYLIAYINRLGLWDYFTPLGRAIKSISIESETNPRLYRNPNSINNSVNHSKNRMIDGTEQTITINTGDLSELMTEQVEEVIYSPLVYLIEFTGELFTSTQVGITVDSTTVTVDSTLYTVDSDTIVTADLGYYSTFTQHPVTCETSNFVKRTRINDKGKINYDLNFNKTVGKINNLR